MRKDIMINNLGLKGINPLTCGQQRCTAGHKWGPSVRDYYIIHYVYSGKGSFQSSGEVINVTEGQMFLICPQKTCNYVADLYDPWVYGWIGFESEYKIEEMFQSEVITLPECRHIFNSLSESDRIKSRREWYISAKIHEIISHLTNNAEKNLEAEKYARMAVNYIETQYMEEVKIADIAKYLGLNRSYFSRIFKEYTGTPPQEYLVNFRLQKAAELLSTQGCSTTEAAALIGYSDPLAFSRMFSRRFGVAPSKYKSK